MHASGVRKSAEGEAPLKPEKRKTRNATWSDNGETQETFAAFQKKARKDFYFEFELLKCAEKSYFFGTIFVAEDLAKTETCFFWVSKDASA